VLGSENGFHESENGAGFLFYYYFSEALCGDEFAQALKGGNTMIQFSASQAHFHITPSIEVEKKGSRI